MFRCLKKTSPGKGRLEKYPGKSQDLIPKASGGTTLPELKGSSNNTPHVINSFTV